MSEKGWLSEDRLAYISILFTLGMGAVTAYALTRVDYLSNDTDTLIWLVVIDALALLVLGTLVGRQIWRLWSERRQRLAGHQLHWRMAVLFGGVTTFPAVIVTLFALFIVDYSLRGWFAERISTAVNESVRVAESYFDEHARSISGEVLTMANDINREAYRLVGKGNLMGRYLSDQAALRNMADAIIFDGTGQVLAKSQFAFAITFANLESSWVEQARKGEVVILRADETNKLRAVVKLNSYVDAYLLVGRFIDSKVLLAMDQTRLAASDYQQLGFQQLDLQISFAVLFGIILLLILIASLWIGLNLATAIVGPLGSVIHVAEQVRGGNLSQRVPDDLQLEEISRLGSAFNRMLDELARSREQLVQANTQIDQRREFTEAVLGGVSSGVIGLDRDGKVTLPNATARSLLTKSDTELIGKKLADVIPEFKGLLGIINQKRRRFGEEQIILQRQNSQLILRARIVSELIEGRVIGYVVTFDDVTGLLSAQRKAAWSDIARRIAHEIKNPLTPIQLASDRLLKKYRPDDKKAADQFEEYVQIITRQVDDIGRMVDEFSAFARMPQPEMDRHSLLGIVNGQISLFADRDLSLDVEIDDANNDYATICDAGLVRQALTNLLQNAKDSLDEHRTATSTIRIKLQSEDDMIAIIVTDNGPGFPEMDFEKLIEPYVTTRQKGTGLGLAIVGKIMEDHSGTMHLGNADNGGAWVCLKFPIHAVTHTEKGQIDG
ncbi:MAG: PAS domain-containing sensor histidine kinase [Proteobacteria bacterium]|nr:PAS domain-containing sensor histidine kinase [Pseudomonadota bacterium]MDA0959964.1 PAS domain-containing sensor histidine kinase [Pseudomonadota bacterium]MDA1151645.1 PAS domain-containing sensor histidine kinase [Pseudomonadota bacterium]